SLWPLLTGPLITRSCPRLSASFQRSRGLWLPTVTPWIAEGWLPQCIRTAAATFVVESLLPSLGCGSIDARGCYEGPRAQRWVTAGGQDDVFLPRGHGHRGRQSALLPVASGSSSPATRAPLPARGRGLVNDGCPADALPGRRGGGFVIPEDDGGGEEEDVVVKELRRAAEGLLLSPRGGDSGALEGREGEEKSWAGTGPWAATGRSPRAEDGAVMGRPAQRPRGQGFWSAKGGGIEPWLEK
ncbi:unnamed protein product, partial [Discosporangium mesarthrocarpum]